MRKLFLAALLAAADDATSPLRVVLSIRSDFVDRVAEDQAFLHELTQGLFFLGAPNRDGLRDAIVQEQRLVESGLVEAADAHRYLRSRTPGGVPFTPETIIMTTGKPGITFSETMQNSALNTARAGFSR